MKPELSIIIISYNEENYLPTLLSSLKMQTFQNFEIIVADNNSTDKTRQIAESYGCKVVEGGTWSTARNKGAKHANGKYLLFMDSDCYISPEFLEINLNKFKKLNIGSASIPLKPIGNHYFDKLMYNVYNIWAKILVKTNPHCAGCGLFIKHNLFKKLGGFNESLIFAEHHELTKRAKSYGFKILPCPIYTSVRRQEKQGRLKFAFKNVYAGFYRILRKEINSPIFEYKPYPEL